MSHHPDQKSSMEEDAPPRSTEVCTEDCNTDASCCDDANTDLQTFHTFEEFQSELDRMELTTLTKHIKGNTQHHNTTGKNFEVNTNLSQYLGIIDKKADIKANWKIGNQTDNIQLTFTGVPFINMSNRQYTCHRGKDVDAKKKIARKQSVDISKRRVRKHPTKKLGCPAQFSVKKVLCFPSHRIS